MNDNWNEMQEVLRRDKMLAVVRCRLLFTTVLAFQGYMMVMICRKCQDKIRPK